MTPAAQVGALAADISRAAVDIPAPAAVVAALPAVAVFAAPPSSGPVFGAVGLLAQDAAAPSVAATAASIALYEAVSVSLGSPQVFGPFLFSSRPRLAVAAALSPVSLWITVVIA